MVSGATEEGILEVESCVHMQELRNTKTWNILGILFVNPVFGFCPMKHLHDQDALSRVPVVWRHPKACWINRVRRVWIAIGCYSRQL